MSVPDPGGSFTSGPASLGTVLNEPTPVAADNPAAPPPQANGTLTAYVDASAQTMQQKAQLLSSIAQLGSAGKQVFNQQQAQTQATRSAGIQSILSATGQAGVGGAAAQAINAAGLAQAGSSANQASSLQDYNNTLAQGANDWYNQINAAIPIMQERTSQQVNAYYAAQRLQAQQQASQVAVANADEQAANARAAEAVTQGGTAQIQQGTASITQGTAQINQNADAIKYGAAGGAQVTAANKAIGAAVQAYPGFQPGTQGNTALWGILGTTDPTTGKPLTQAQIQAYVNQLYDPTNKNHALVNGVDRNALVGFINSYFQGNPPPTPPAPIGLSQAAAAALTNATRRLWG